MPLVTFDPHRITIEVEAGTSLLLAAKRSAAPLRYGCGAAQCGQCAVRITESADLSAVKSAEGAMLTRLGFSDDVQIRLACQAKVREAPVTVDLSFQDTYDPGGA